MEENKDKPSYPPELIDSMILENYQKASFRVQAAGDIMDNLEWFNENQKKIIDNFMRSKGHIIYGEKEDGTEDNNTVYFQIKSIFFRIEYNEDARIVYWEMGEDVLMASVDRFRETELEMILQTIVAVFCRDKIDVVREWMDSRIIDIWNSEVIRGMHAKGKLALEEPYMMSFGFSGANINTINKKDRYIVKLPEADDLLKTEYGGF